MPTCESCTTVYAAGLPVCPHCDTPALLAAPESPALNASTADWAAYAVACGHDPVDVDDLTRTELIELTTTEDDQ